jgi:hypothetical protein
MKAIFASLPDKKLIAPAMWYIELILAKHGSFPLLTHERNWYKSERSWDAFFDIRRFNWSASTGINILDLYNLIANIV